MVKRRKRRRYAALLKDRDRIRNGTGGVKLHELDHDPLQAAHNTNIMITTHHRCKLSKLFSSSPAIETSMAV